MVLFVLKSFFGSRQTIIMSCEIQNVINKEVMACYIDTIVIYGDIDDMSGTCTGDRDSLRQSLQIDLSVIPKPNNMKRSLTQNPLGQRVVWKEEMDYFNYGAPELTLA